MGRLSRYTHNHNNPHCYVVIRLFKYSSIPRMLKGYYDSNWKSDTMDTKSTSGYVFIFCGGVISWKSTMQTCEAHSTMEAEFCHREGKCRS